MSSLEAPAAPTEEAYTDEAARGAGGGEKEAEGRTKWAAQIRADVRAVDPRVFCVAQAMFARRATTEASSYLSADFLRGPNGLRGASLGTRSSKFVLDVALKIEKLAVRGGGKGVSRLPAS